MLQPHELKEERQRLGAELTLLREAKKLTRQGLASISGLSRNTIYRLETGATACMTDVMFIYKKAIERYDA